jgi:hypothetical protein
MADPEVYVGTYTIPWDGMTDKGNQGLQESIYIASRGEITLKLKEGVGEKTTRKTPSQFRHTVC